MATVAANSTVEQDVVTALPYPPSWIDRLTDWVQRLPGPAWLFYLGVALALALIRTIAAWGDGSYPAGTFLPVHVLLASTSVFYVFVVHYLDDRAGAALADFRPVLNVGPEATRDAGYERLRYQLTTMPARPILAWSLVGLLFGVINQPLFVPETQLQSLKLYTSPALFAIDSGLFALNWMMNAVFIYHTIRQLRLVSRTYTQHTNVNIFETGPLYALSRVTAITAVAILFLSYLYLSFWSNWQFQTAGDATIAASFTLVALATFMWPLLGGHTLLQQEKARRKSEVALRMQAVTDKLHRRVDTDDMRGMEGLKDALDGLVVEQGVLDKVSTWPWEPESLRAVVTALLLPVALWVVTRVLERLGF
jgi:hypothetical protein